MGVLDDLLGELLARSLDSWDERYKRETAAMRTRALASINERLPLLVGYLRELTDHSDMIRAGRVPLMELGELEWYTLPGTRQSSRRVLYLGSDGCFYVFGPADFGRRIDKDPWLDRYDGANGKPVLLTMRRLAVGEDTDHNLVSLVRERVVSAFI